MQTDESKSAAATPPKALYWGRSLAYRRYRQNAWATRQLLAAGLSGLEEQLTPMRLVLEKLQDVKGMPGRFPKNHKPEVQAQSAGGLIHIEMDMRTAVLIKQAAQDGVSLHKKLRFHFYSIVAAYVWGMYETYVGMLFEELYQLKPQLLKSNETLTFRDAIDHKDNLLELLIDQQLDRIGHFTMSETLKYLEDRINYRPSSAMRCKLSQYYFVRNIVAHSTGLVRSEQAAQLPPGTSEDNRELRITKGFLQRMMAQLGGHITRIERHTEKKFFRTA